MIRNGVEVRESVVTGAIESVAIEKTTSGQARPYADHVDTWLVTFTGSRWGSSAGEDGRGGYVAAPAFVDGTEEWSNGRETDDRPAFVELALSILGLAGRRTKADVEWYQGHTEARVVGDGVVEVVCTSPYID